MRLAKKLHLVFLYTGAMYRALAYLCMKLGVSTKDRESVISTLRAHDIDFGDAPENGQRPYSVHVDSEDVTDKLFIPEIDQGSSDVGVYPEVRTHMVARQRAAAIGKRVVMEGRDIGLRVLPDADLKIYLTASAETRAKRRLLQYEKKGKMISLGEMIADTKRRDHQDMTRTADPLQKLPDAWELDTTDMTEEMVTEAIISELRKRSLL